MQGALARENSQHAEAGEHEHEEEEGGGEIGGLSRGLMAGGGSPLPDGVRTQMEQSFGHDFSAVRVHEGSGQAAALGAQAYAHGSDLHFAPGQYDPASQSGRELIGHELAHVVQQGGTAGPIGPQGKGADLGGSMALEREADLAGAAAARGERAHVSGVGSGIQFKKPVDRSWLDAAKGPESQKIADAHVTELKKRLSAKCELRFTTKDDGQLIEDLEEAASDKVKSVAAAELAGNPQQMGDVQALSEKIAQRSKAVKNAVSEKSRTIADAIGQTYHAVFKAAAEQAFKDTSVSRISIKPLVIQQAIASAKMAANRLDESEYQKAKTKLDDKLNTEAVALKTELTTLTETKTEKRAKDATTKRKDTRIDKKVTDIAKAAEEPIYNSLHDEVEKYISHGLGASGAGWFRGQEVRNFRAEMKRLARKQAKEDIDTDLSARTGLGGARSRYVGMEAKLEAYDDAKDSVNTALSEAATQLTDKLFVDEKVADGLLDVARRAAFSVYEDEGHQPAATSAAVAAAKAHSKSIHQHLMTEAKTRKDALRDAPTGTTARDDLEKEVVQQVKDDEVGKRSVDAAIKGTSPEEGMAKLGHFFDFMVPERGDAIKFKVSLEVPAGPGNVLIELQGDAERGTRERLLKKDKTTGVKTVERDTQSLKLGAEIRIGYTGSFPGIKIQGALGFFLRSDAASTDMCMKALSYGIYRFLTGAIPPLANLWGGSSKKAQGMSESDPNNVDDDLKDDVYRSELWAAMIEDEVFNKDKEARVDLGVSLSGGGEVDGGVAKAKAGLRFEGMRTYDKEAFKKSIRKYKQSHTGSTVKLGDDQFDKQGAKERREAISGRTTGSFLLETEVECEIAGQKSVFGLKAKIAPPDWEVELSGGIKLSSADPASKEVRLYAGIANAAQNGLKMLIGMIRNIVDKDHAMAGMLGDVSDYATRSLGDINNLSNNKFGDSISQGYQVDKGVEDYANQDINKFLGGKQSEQAPETQKAGFQSEQTFKVGIIFGNVKPFMVKIDEVQTQKVKVGGPSGPGLNIEYEKSRRVAQIGVSGGRFHAEGLGVSTKT